MLKYGQVGSKLGNFSPPVFKKRTGSDYQASGKPPAVTRIPDGAYYLHRLAEPHFVGKESPKPLSHNEAKPAPPICLIIVQLGPDCVRCRLTKANHLRSCEGAFRH